MKRIGLLLGFLLSASVASAQIQPATQPVNAALTSTTCTGVPGLGSGCLSLNVTGYSTLAVQLVGTFSATATFQVSKDGVNYVTVSMTPPNSLAPVTTATGAGLWSGSVAGFNWAQVILTAYSSGTVNVQMQATVASAPTVSSGGSSGNVSVVQGGNTAAVNASGQLSITCANCSGSGASAVDESAFTVGTTAGAPSMGLFMTTPSTLTSGTTGAVGMTNRRELYGVIRDGAGNARSANVSSGNALLVDASATTQPVTVSAGSALMGKAGIDQTTAGSTNLVSTSAQGSSAYINDVVCDKAKIYDASTSGATQLIAISGSTHVYICGFTLFSAGTANVSLVAGTGTNCASAASGANNVGTTGAAAALTPAYQLIAQTGLKEPSPTHGYLIDAGSANAVCLNASAGVAVQAELYYSQR